MRPLILCCLALSAAALAAGCFDPQYPDRAFACSGPGPDACPEGFSCVNKRCVRGGAQTDGGTDSRTDSGTDGRTDSAVLKPSLTCSAPEQIGLLSTAAIVRPVEIILGANNMPTVFYLNATGSAVFRTRGSTGWAAEQTVGATPCTDCQQIAAAATSGGGAHVLLGHKATLVTVTIDHTYTASLTSPAWTTPAPVAIQAGGKQSLYATTFEIAASDTLVALTAVYAMSAGTLPEGTAIAAMEVTPYGGTKFTFSPLCTSTLDITGGASFKASRIAVDGNAIVLGSSATGASTASWSLYYLTANTTGTDSCSAAGTMTHTIAGISQPEAMAVAIDGKDVGAAYVRGGSGSPDTLFYQDTQVGGTLGAWDTVTANGENAKAGSPDVALHTQAGRGLTILSYASDKADLLTIAVADDSGWYRTTVQDAVKEYTRMVVAGDTIHVVYDQVSGKLTHYLVKYVSCRLGFK